MRSTGSHQCLIALGLLLAVLVAAAPARAELTAAVDRSSVSLGDSLRLTITATGNTELSDADLRPLLEDFEILQRSTNSQMQIVNGHASHTRQLQLDLAPLRQGTLLIPRLSIGAEHTPAITIQVTETRKTATGGESVLFEAEVDQDTVYVQGQLILTLRVSEAINVDNRSVSEFSVEGAFIHPLEQQSFQRNIDGRQWWVHELRYALFPEQSGTLRIPEQVFTARESAGRRSLFDFGSGGRSLRRVTAPLEVTVLPRPDHYPAGDWLPAANLSIEESWSAPPESLRVGDSATRTITLRGEGLQGAQLPPITFTPVAGLKFYPDQPEISEIETDNGLAGTRVDSAAVVPTAPGDITLPEVRIPWWDTKTEEIKYVALPARTFKVLAAQVATEGPASGNIDIAAPSVSTAGPAVAPATANSLLPWQAATAVATLLWLCTLGWLLRLRRAASAPVSDNAPSTGEKAAFKQLIEACNCNDSAAARSAAISWIRDLGGEPVTSLAQAASATGDEDFARECARLDECRYGAGENMWSGKMLAECAQQLRKASAAHGSRTPAKLRLYPTD